LDMLEMSRCLGVLNTLEMSGRRILKLNVLELSLEVCVLDVSRSFGPVENVWKSNLKVEYVGNVALFWKCLFITTSLQTCVSYILVFSVWFLTC
jgi:hypothetical protein